uniref:C-type lectin domain-containing protein n=2 Tax=Panagrellus redivivus TaxID=6233 RepID=A0A7E4W4Z6_PANRE
MASFLRQGSRNMYVKAALILLLCSTVSCDLIFIHLYGYSVTGDTADTFNTTKPQECADACYDYSGCIAFRMVWNTGQCYFYLTVRNIVYDASECGFYIYSMTVPTYVQGRTLSSPIDQQTQNLVYYTYYSCPAYWSTSTSKKRCRYTMAESTCNEYAPFLEASWNASDSKCYMPFYTSTLTCPDDVYTYDQYEWNTNYVYCYYYLNEWTPSGDSDLYKQANDYCSAQVGGRVVDILSDDENAYIATYLSENETMIIGLIPKNGTVSTLDDLEWNSGMPKDYVNFTNGAEPTPTNSFKLTVINAAGQWDTAAETMNFKGLVCKRDVINSLTVA